MAKFTAVPAVTETRVVEVEPAKYTLELTAAEVVALGIILNNIGGSPIHTLRGYADEIANALPDANTPEGTISGTIYFIENSRYNSYFLEQVKRVADARS